jgi:hypothetical protein
MKSFLQFLTETSASQQAARLGLEGDGHGGWYDRKTGEFTAKTEKGTLKFYNKRQVVGGIHHLILRFLPKGNKHLLQSNKHLLQNLLQKK